ncbi:SWR1 complex subunit 2 [Silene latifolia]|uniref:SWR1 complex subunit 2 n=1 Tax=Silene latifolia TaxID=37657 RepID=UPI003D774140
MESSKQEQQAILDRTSRATRGKRMSKLLDEEAEEDEAFWNQDALKEEEHDDEYEDEGEVADEFDSDFDEDVSEPDDEEQNEAEAREKDRPPKKRLIYSGKPAPKKRKKDLSKLEESLRDEMMMDVSKSDEGGDDEKLSEQVTTPDHAEDTDEVEGEKTVRKSTRTAVIVRQAEREAIRAALQATTKPIKRKKEGEEKRMTQEEMLLEAAQTEIMNLRNLERVLAREEEVKKRAIVHKAVYTGPQIRYISKNGQSFLEFNNGLKFESELTTKFASYPKKAVCAVTGLPARYRDPMTGLPYATKEAFQILRERYVAENSYSQGKVASGDVYDAIAGQGFVGRKKRSLIPHQNENEVSRDSRRFCRIPVAEILDSD